MKKVWINGSFDILHIGHIRLINYGKSFGSIRVGLDTDNRIREKKGQSRPLNKLSDRMEFMSSINGIDSVVSFDTDSELSELIKEYKPDYLVIGDDYMGKPIIGSEYAKEIVYFNKINGYSTTDLIYKCKKNVTRATHY
jgi:D-beta-D-heptose 7-phosphate kinase/D-beta-D-heptose 1-phosphate adenosyltransferase